MIELELDASEEWPTATNWQSLGEKALNAAISQSQYGPLANKAFALSVSISLSDNAQVHELNKQWRGKDKPTNVLSFPMLDADGLNALANTDDGEVLLGDMILAHETCQREAQEKGITLEQHVTHLIIHGMLHLLGYDHMEDIEAEAMEQLEIKALASMGLPNPYSDQD